MGLVYADIELINGFDIQLAGKKMTGLAENSEILLGCIPMEDMDAIVHAQKQQLILTPGHEDMPLMPLK